MPGILSVRHAGFEHAILRLEEARVRFPLAPRKIVDEGADVILEALRRLVPKRTHRMEAGLRSHVSGTVATFTSSAPYSRPVIHGARPHVILAGVLSGRSGKKALHWPGARHPVGHVNHPGNAPNPFPRRALHESKPMIMELSRRVAREIFG